MLTRILRVLRTEKTRKRFGTYNIVSPTKLVETTRHIPNGIKLPSYVANELHVAKHSQLVTHGDEVRKLKDTCSLAARILSTAAMIAKPGATTQDIDDLVYQECIESGAYPSPLNYRGFPKSVCTSVNNVAAHGIPDTRKLEAGDIINIDITIFRDGFHGDTSKTVLVGEVDHLGQHLVEITENCLIEAIKICKPGAPLNTIGKVIQSIASSESLNVISRFCGHGIGKDFHCPPDILHFENDYDGVMVPGMVFTIEPILTQGVDDIEILNDGWTAVTTDHARTAQFEHTILITPMGHEILTK